MLSKKTSSFVFGWFDAESKLDLDRQQSVKRNTEY